MDEEYPVKVRYPFLTLFPLPLVPHPPIVEAPYIVAVSQGPEDLGSAGRGAKRDQVHQELPRKTFSTRSRPHRLEVRVDHYRPPVILEVSDAGFGDVHRDTVPA